MIKKSKLIRDLSKIFLSRSDRHILTEVSNISLHQVTKIQEALWNLSYSGGLPLSHYWVKRIETERNRLLNLNESLVDGTLGKGGMHDFDKKISEICLRASKPIKACQMLYLIARSIQASSVIELGTNVGISSSYIGAALKVNDMNGILTTIDASPYRLRVAKSVHQNLALDNITYVQGLFSDVLENSLRDVPPIDLAFIDGHHQYQATLDYFEKIVPFSSNNAVFIFDDIRWSEGMKKAWSELRLDQRFAAAIDLNSFGVCVLSCGENTQHYTSSPIYCAS